MDFDILFELSQKLPIDLSLELLNYYCLSFSQNKKNIFFYDEEIERNTIEEFDLLNKISEGEMNQSLEMLKNEISLLPKDKQIFILKQSQNLFKNNFTIPCNCSDNICLFLHQMESCKNYTDFILLNPIFEVLFSDKNIVFTLNPIIFPKTKFNIVQNNLINLLNIKYIYDDECIKFITKISIYDYSMRNLFYLKMHPELAKVFVLEIYEMMRNSKFTDFFNNRNFDPNIWIYAFLSISKNNKSSDKIQIKINTTKN